jgi:DUF4097 and DUF4098 domain-containing protein YvlB
MNAKADGRRTVRVGRYTAAGTLTALGILLLLDNSGQLQIFEVLRHWWPAVIVAFGLELLFVQAFNRELGTKIRIAFGTLFGALFLSALVMAGTRGSEITFPGLPAWAAGVSMSFQGDHAKFSIDQELKVVPMRDTVKSVSIQGSNGTVTLRHRPVADMEIRTVVRVDVSERARAEELAAQSAITVKDGEMIEISADGQTYGTGQLKKVQMDLTITFPDGRIPAHLLIQTGNGDVLVEAWPDSASQLEIDVKNGDITADHVLGSVQVKTMNGDVRLSEIGGDAEVEVVHGDIELTEAGHSVKASTVNGDIRLRSSKVGGDWDVSSTMGDLTLAWPEGTGVKVRASSEFGDIGQDWQLREGNKEVSGVIGDGSRSITAETHTDISLEKFAP